MIITPSYGIPYTCEELVPGSILEGQCHSGRNKDCHGRNKIFFNHIYIIFIFLFCHEGEFNYIECCEGKYMGQEVGPTDQCNWRYSTHLGHEVGRYCL